MLLGSPSVVGVVGEARDKQIKHHNTITLTSSKGYTTSRQQAIYIQLLNRWQSFSGLRSNINSEKAENCLDTIRKGE